MSGLLGDHRQVGGRCTQARVHAWWAGSAATPGAARPARRHPWMCPRCDSRVLLRPLSSGSAARHALLGINPLCVRDQHRADCMVAVQA